MNISKLMNYISDNLKDQQYIFIIGGDVKTSRTNITDDEHLQLISSIHKLYEKEEDAADRAAQLIERKALLKELLAETEKELECHYGECLAAVTVYEKYT